MQTFTNIKGDCFEKAKAMETDFQLMIEGRLSEKEVLSFSEELLAMPGRYGNRDRLLWALDDPHNMPGDALYDFVCYSSFMAVTSLAYAGMLFPSVQKLSDYWGTLQQGLTDCIGTNEPSAECFFGHGYESVDSFLDCMNMFADGQLPLFLEMNHNISPIFEQAFHCAVTCLEKELCTGKICDIWSEEPYTERANAIMEKLNRRAIFVYGTLMSGQSAGSRLSGCESMGKHLLRGYAMYPVATTYPGIVPCPEENVVGEAFLIPVNLLPNLDTYEGEGSLYHRKLVTVERAGKHILAQAYIYAHSAGNIGKPMRKSWDAQPNDRVWYAAYGSNLCSERFRYYIQGGLCPKNQKNYDGCRDKTLWTDSCLMDFPGEMYFAQKSRTWSGNGVSFYAPSRPGITHMRLYNITRDQMNDVQTQEGPSANWYGRLVLLGIHEDGSPVYTFTSETKQKRNAPSKSYLELIREALVEECELDSETVDAYLTNCLNA